MNQTNSATDPGLTTGVPIYNLHGDIVVSNYADLWGGSLAGLGLVGLMARQRKPA